MPRTAFTAAGAVAVRVLADTDGVLYLEGRKPVPAAQP